MAVLSETSVNIAPAPSVVDLTTQAVPQQSFEEMQRELALRRLLDGPYESSPSMGNYEYARDSGLLDKFVYDPASGDDAILHILAGNVKTGADGAEIVEGFHHEPSAAYGQDLYQRTYVDRSDHHTLNKKKRTELADNGPFETYKAHTVVAGRKKLTTQNNPESGQPEVVAAKSGMFPKEYDGLAVLQAIRLAADSRDRDHDERQENGNVLNVSYAPMIDGESLMKIRLVFNSDTSKIVSAYPIVKVGGIMKLSAAAIDSSLGLA